MLQLLCMADEKWYPWEESELQEVRPGRPWLTIGLPMIIGILIVAAVITAVLNTGFGSIGTWADVSLIFVLLPICVLGFLPLILIIALCYGLGRLVGWLPEPLRKVDAFLIRASHEARRGSNLLAQPMFVLHGVAATIRAFFRGLLNLFH